MLADAFLEGVKRNDDEYRQIYVEPSLVREAAAFASTKIDEAKEIVARSGIFDPDALEAAVGKPGEDGDPEAIAALAARWVKDYEEMLAWGAELRDRPAPPPIHLLYSALALLITAAIKEIRDFAEQFDRDVHRVVADLQATGREPPPLVERLTLTVDDNAQQALERVEDWLNASLGPDK